MPIERKGAREAARKIRCLVLDVDGVCTDGKLYYFPDGQVVKCFDCHDGIGIQTALKNDLEIGVITGRTDPCTAQRMNYLGVRHLFMGHAAKLAALEEIRAALDLNYEQMAFLGDDFVDLDPLRLVGLPCAVGNARAQVKDEALVVAEADGGRGAVREIIEYILQSRTPGLDLTEVWTSLPRK